MLPKLLKSFFQLFTVYCYALLLQQTGHLKQAASLFQEILTHAKLFNINLETEQEWVAIARQGGLPQ